MDLLCWQPGQKEYPEVGGVLGCLYSIFIKMYKTKKRNGSASSIERTAQILCLLYTTQTIARGFSLCETNWIFHKTKFPCCQAAASPQLHRDVTALLHGLRSAELSQLLFLPPQADLVSVHRHCFWIRPDCRRYKRR